jgi:hypothetical protein
LIDRSRHDPFSLSYPFVTPGHDGSPWHMIYGTSRASGILEAEMQHVLTEAFSSDGINWQPTGNDVVSLKADEYGLSRPWIFEVESDRYLLFSIRKATYSLGLARWDHLACRWIRIDDDLLSGAVEAWERNATCYASAIVAAGQLLMFYCGFNYGRTGFGVARIDSLKPLAKLSSDGLR